MIHSFILNTLTIQLKSFSVESIHILTPSTSGPLFILVSNLKFDLNWHLAQKQPAVDTQKEEG